MLTKTLTGVFLVCVCLFPGLPAVPVNQTATDQDVPKDVDVKLHKECLYPVIQLVETGKTAGSTGFIVRTHKVSNNVYCNAFLTCAHCVSDNKQEVVFFDYEDWSYVRRKTHYPCIFYGVDDDLDVAVGYFLSDRLLPRTKLDTECKMYIGSDILKIGCGKGQEPRVDFGKITKPVRKDELTEKYIRHSASTCFGDSGGPLFYRHKVVGIINRVQQHNSIPIWQFAYAIPISRLYGWSKTNDGAYDHVFDDQVEIPRMPQYRLEFINKYEITQ